MILCVSGAGKSMMHSSEVANHRLWFPGQGCPVLGCGARIFRKTYDFKRHWREKHENIVATFPCSMCPYTSKRRFDVVQHFTLNHRSFLKENVKQQCVGEVMYGQNQRYVDPHPLTLEAVLGSQEYPHDFENS